MTNAAVQERVIEVVAETFGLDSFGVGEDASAQNLAAWTSLAHLRLMASLEEQFGVEFTTDEMIAMTSVAKIADVLAARGT